MIERLLRPAVGQIQAREVEPERHGLLRGGAEDGGLERGEHLGVGGHGTSVGSPPWPGGAPR
jgi:hypothetical protein